MSSSDKKKELVVIGGGPGGYAAAFFAADRGMQVTLVDPEENPGGVCLYRGCIPSKALLHAAKVIHEAAEADSFGVTFGEPTIDLEKLRGWKEQVVDQLTGGLGQLQKQRKVEHLRGKARFTSSHELAVDMVEGGEQRVSFEHAIIATGSRAASIPGLPEESERIWHSRRALELPEIPKSLLVIGGGYIGLELGTVYEALGSEVTVVEMLPGLLTGADRDLARLVERSVKQRFAMVMTKTRVSSIKEQKNGVLVEFDGKKTEDARKLYDAVLVSVGRKPATDGLGLENTGVVVGEDGFIQVDDQLRTGDSAIFAIGDVVGQPMLAHKASHEGRVAVRAIQGEKMAFEPRGIPAVVFTDPELAWAGLTEEQAKQEEREVEILKFPWAASGRAKTVDRVDGLTKLVVHPDSGRLLGIGIVGPGAGEMIAEGVLALEMAAYAEDLSLTIHPHPTLSETIMEAADLFFGESTHYIGRRRK